MQMLDINWLKDNYAKHVWLARNDDNFSRKIHHEDEFFFSPNHNACIIINSIHEYRMFVEICSAVLVIENVNTIVFYDLVGWHLTPHENNVWIDDNIFFLGYEAEATRAAVEYYDISRMKKFEIPYTPLPASGTTLVKDEHFRYVAKPIPIVRTNPYQDAYKKHLPNAQWENIDLLGEKEVKIT